MEIEELARIIIFVLFLAVAVFVVIVVFKGKGGTLLDSLRRSLRFG